MPVAILCPVLAEPQRPSTTFVCQSPFLSEGLPFGTFLPPTPLLSALTLCPFCPQNAHTVTVLCLPGTRVHPFLQQGGVGFASKSLSSCPRSTELNLPWS